MKLAFVPSVLLLVTAASANFLQNPLSVSIINLESQKRKDPEQGTTVTLAPHLSCTHPWLTYKVLEKGAHDSQRFSFNLHPFKDQIFKISDINGKYLSLHSSLSESLVLCHGEEKDGEFFKFIPIEVKDGKHIGFLATKNNKLLYKGLNGWMMAMEKSEWEIDNMNCNESHRGHLKFCFEISYQSRKVTKKVRFKDVIE
ncbi:hypothetical protein ROZALSC1DRAFT_30010 [Rozella allomycis CSF55]|uniref:Ricin B lectin domain-containing protein n=1 Tax=Rozella allomycis (strain CSF55) TaxID=988480 RepID=A0A075B098_ROZAC|nr:hypothetical protein O9G_003284 [Rozella allomycis CSF55]RKP18281.1 hypothetical protein ROZALSC1DRAFT_30010 [Rozella allomycis CSF55]|eukprot:EPZ35800.1 hypothetical protein O9G_003284 [Rozella allomycis CSF55]